LLPLHLEGAALGLDRLLEAPDGLALLLEGQLLARARDAEQHQLALDLGELGVPVLQRHLRRLASSTLPLQGRPSVDEGGLLLLEPSLSSLTGGVLLQELVLSNGERRDLGVEGGLQVVGLLDPLLERACPLLGPALLRLRPFERRAEPPVLAADAGHLASQLVASVRIFSRSEHACRSASSRSMRAVQTRLRLEGRAGSCLVLS
jgi:hypothetical protein